MQKFIVISIVLSIVLGFTSCEMTNVDPDPVTTQESHDASATKCSYLSYQLEGNDMTTGFYTSSGHVRADLCGDFATYDEERTITTFVRLYVDFCVTRDASGNESYWVYNVTYNDDDIMEYTASVVSQNVTKVDGNWIINVSFSVEGRTYNLNTIYE